MSAKDNTKIDLTGLTPEKVKAVQARSEGASWGEVGKSLGMSRQTMWEWRQSDEKFAEACAQAEERCIDRIEEALEVAATKVGDDPRFTTAAIFALKNKRSRSWSDVNRVEHSGTVNLAMMSEDEIKRRSGLIDEG